MRMTKFLLVSSFAALTATAGLAQDANSDSDEVVLPTLPEAGAGPVTNFAFLAPALGFAGIAALGSGGSTSTTSATSTN